MVDLCSGMLALHKPARLRWMAVMPNSLCAVSKCLQAGEYLNVASFTA